METILIMIKVTPLRKIVSEKKRNFISDMYGMWLLVNICITRRKCQGSCVGVFYSRAGRAEVPRAASD